MTQPLSPFAGIDPPEIQTRSHDRYHAVMKACDEVDGSFLTVSKCTIGVR